MYDAAAYRAAIMANRPAAYWPLTSGRDRVAPVSWTGFERVRDGVWPEPPNTEEMPVTMLDADTHDRMVNEIAIQADRADRAEARATSLERSLRQAQDGVGALLCENTVLTDAVTDANVRAAALSGQLAAVAQGLERALTTAIAERAR